MAEAAAWSDLTGTARRNKPWLDGLSRLIFVSDMSDALSSVVPFDFLEDEVVRTATSPNGQRHHWLWLTKRPERMAKFSDYLKSKGVLWPRNLWAGTSITTQATISRIRHLLRVGDDDTIRFLSVEPQHEEINFGKLLPRLDWIIQGGESGQGAEPFCLEWALDIIQQSKKAGVAYFLKQLGSTVLSEGRRLTFIDGHAGDWSEWPQEVRIRQMPERIRATLHGQRPPPAVASNRVVTIQKRRSLPVVEIQSKGTQTALKAWATRRANEQRKARSKAAKNARRTHRTNKEKGVD
jgi:protein gp37